MKLYESYVAEAKARRRRRLAVGIVGAVTLATVAVTALLVLNPPLSTRDRLNAGCASAIETSVTCGRFGESTAS